MDKKEYQWLMQTKKNLEKGKPTTFHERNALNIYNKRMAKIKKKI